MYMQFLDVPLAVISDLRIGCLEYSLASARRTSFLTIWSWLLPAPWVSPSTAVPSSYASLPDDTAGDDDARRRVGGGDGEASVSYTESRKYFGRPKPLGTYYAALSY